MKNFCTCADPFDLQDAIQLTQRDQKDCNRKPASLHRKVWITCKPEGFLLPVHCHPRFSEADITGNDVVLFLLLCGPFELSSRVRQEASRDLPPACFCICARQRCIRRTASVRLSPVGQAGSRTLRVSEGRRRNSFCSPVFFRVVSTSGTTGTPCAQASANAPRSKGRIPSA